ncbi:MAG: pantoate--beta-alanine ligase [Bacteroidetes bacterium]|nr:pantoate--beta-alanine ligase [Bacteroidota bacterium]
MILFKKATELHKWLDFQRKKQKSIGFVPTMGALHTGHLSLIGYSQRENDITVCSVFVNPTQFNDPRDFEKYPITIEKDIAMLEEAGTHVLFLPSVPEMYPDGLQATRQYELGFLETRLEGAFRPGHFQGVCRVVHRLLEIVQPASIYLGQKDYQQCMVIRKLVTLMGKEGSISVMVCPTLRETDGLAMSSRNMRLNEDQRKKAVTISQVLTAIKQQLHTGDLSALLNEGQRVLEAAGFRTDYLEITDARTLEPVTNWNGTQSLVALVAAFMGDIRLIDNMVLTQNNTD